MQVVWVEIPVKNLERAMTFYTTVFDLEPADIADDDVRRTATLASDMEGGKAGISLNQTTNFEPSDKGPFVYLDAGEDLTDALGRVEEAGGKVIEAKTSMGGAGYYATVVDTEGNCIALYSYK